MIFNNWDVNQAEVFQFMGTTFDVREAKRILKAFPRETEKVPVSVLKQFLPKRGKLSLAVGIDWKLIDAAKETPGIIDLKIPLIIATLKTSSLPIDGWHRAMLAVETKIRILPCVHLTSEETEQIM